MLRAAVSNSSSRPSRSGFVEQLECIERFERLEHTRAKGVPSRGESVFLRDE